MKEKTMSRPAKVNPVPAGYHTITPFLVVNGAAKLLDFIKTAFDGETTSIMKHKDGSVMHATAKIGNSNIMVADEMDRFPSMPCMLYLYVNDVDQFYDRAIQAGGQSLREPTNEFYGDRSAGIKDAWNNQWWIASHIEDVNTDELKKRAEEFRHSN